MVWIASASVVALCVGGYARFKRRLIDKRFEALTSRFGEEIARRILNGDVWQGATEAMLLEALGKPEAIDEKVNKTNTRHVWKYKHRGANRYGLRVTVENGAVTGWEASDRVKA